MSISAGTIVPPAVVLAVAGWSCWTIVAESTPPAAKPKPIESAAGLLEPEFGATSDRDPFALPGEPEPAAPGKAGPGGAPAKAEESLAAKIRRRLAEVNARLLAVRAAEARRAAMLAGLARMPLAATSVHADRPTAILAGRAYHRGDTIEGTEAALGPVVLAEVRTTSVVLRCDAGSVVVGFPESSSRAARAPRSAPAGATPAKRSKGGMTVRGKAR